MRYIVIPPKQVMDSIINNETKQPARWGIHDMLREVCWGAQEWRQNETNLKAFERCYSAFDGKKEGDQCNGQREGPEAVKSLPGGYLGRLTSPQGNQSCGAYGDRHPEEVNGLPPPSIYK